MGDWNTLAEGLGYIDEEQMFIDMYQNHHLSLTEMASRLGSGKATIRRRMELYGIEKRGRGGANNHSNKKTLLYFLDQRYVRGAQGNEIAHVINSHPSTVWKYLAGKGDQT